MGSLGVLVWVMLTGGLVTSQEPLPPLGKMRHPTDFEAHFADCQRLKQCLENPEANNARRLRDDARDFVLQLTRRRPTERMKHAQVRSHPMLQPLDMVRFDASFGAVETWCSNNQPPNNTG